MSVAPDDKDTSGISKVISFFKTTQWVIAILCMIGAGLFGDLILRKLLLPAESQGAVLQARGYDSLLATYLWLLVVAFVLIWLATGLGQMRRPVRPIGMSVFGLFTLKMVMGSVLIMPMANAFLHSLDQSQISPQAIWAKIGTGFIILTLAFCIATLFSMALFLFYRSRALKAILEKRDPAKYWTDAVPPSLVLGCVLFADLILDAVSNLIKLNITIYGLTLPDPVKACVLLAGIALLAYLVRGFARKQALTWYVALFSAPLWLATNYSSGFVIPDSMAAQVAELTKRGIDFNKMMGEIIPILNWIALAQFSLFIGYLLAVKKHFRSPALRGGLPGQTGSSEPIKIYATQALMKGDSKLLLWLAWMAGLGLMTHSYLIFSSLLLFIVLLPYFSLFRFVQPAVVLGERGFSLPLATSPFTAHYAYADIKAIQLFSILKKGTRWEPSDTTTLNLYIGNMRETDIARLKHAFVAKGLKVSEMPQAGT